MSRLSLPVLAVAAILLGIALGARLAHAGTFDFEGMNATLANRGVPGPVHELEALTIDGQGLELYAPESSSR